ncbi:MAG: 6-bladed beta-propeller [Balneolaceae bacterium]
MMNLLRSSGIVLLYTIGFLLAVSCSHTTEQVQEVNTSGLPELDLNHQFTISDSEEVMLQQITGVQSDSEGRIFLQDPRALQIHVFDTQGEYLTNIGRDGSGPGEFRSLLNIYIGQLDRLIVYDIRQAQNTVFVENDHHWEPVDLFLVEGHRYGIESADTEGNVILRQSQAQYPEPGAFWFEHELATGNLASGLTEQNVLSFKERGILMSDSGSSKGLPFGRTTVVSTDPSGNIYLVWNEQFELAVYNARMEHLDSLSVPIPNQPIDSEERDAAIDRLGNDFRSLGHEHVPVTKPVISKMFVDGNRRIWLQTFDSPEYLVLDREGTPLRSFDLEEDLRLVHADTNRLYAMELSEEGYQIHVFDYQL